MEKFLAFAFLMVVLPSSGMVGEAVSHTQMSSDSVHKLSQANSDFALRLYKQLVAASNSSSQNIFFSPLSISLSLSTLSLGARENTLSQILQVLGYNNITNNDPTLLGEIFHRLLEHVNNLRNGIKMESSLYVQKGREIHRNFLKEAEQFYNTKTLTVDFHEQTTKDRINAVVKNKTEGKIPNLLTEPISRDTLMLLLNYILFKGEWLKPFNPTKTYETDFYVNSSTTVRVPMMKKIGNYYVTDAKDLSSEVLLMEYARNASIIILLPKSGKIAELEQKLSTERFYQLLMSMRKIPVEVHLPKMTLRTEYKLNTVLSSMGIEDAFNSNANFSGISEKHIHLSQMIHKTMLEVDEKGKVGSVSAELRKRSASPVKPFNCNRPFLILIADNHLKTVLFAGRVTNPSG